MNENRYEAVPGAQRLWRRMLLAAAGSYSLDTVLLFMFHVCGVIPVWVPLAYGAAGVGSCAGFYTVIAGGLTRRCADENVTLLQLVVAVAIQLLFMTLAPAVALYFVTALFTIFAFGSLRLRAAEAFGAWLVTSVLMALIIGFHPHTLDIPRATLAIRVLDGLTIVLTLGRCMTLGLYSSRLRRVLGERFALTRVSLELVERRSMTVANSLHEGLGQELTGISMLLSAVASRLRREGHAGAEEVANAAAHLGGAVQTARALANSVHPMSGRLPSDRLAS